MKKMRVVAVALAMATAMGMTAYAGEWKKDQTGWWYDNGDGTWQNGGWFRDADGIYYYFNESGYMLADAVTPDGYYVDPSGAWAAEPEKMRDPGIAPDPKQAASYIVDYYNTHGKGGGNYVVFDDETVRRGNKYEILVRYQMSEAEAEERIRRGAGVAANILEAELQVDCNTGEITYWDGTRWPNF